MRKPVTKSPQARQRSPGGKPGSDAALVDAQYGLEPVYEPGQDARQRPLDAAVEIECPYCWQSYEASVDLTLGAQAWVEDCQHCCHPIAVAVEVIGDGRGARLEAKRLDE